MTDYYALGFQDGKDHYFRPGVERLSVTNADEYEQGYADADAPDDEEPDDEG